jgi:hypothetical protein
MINAYWEDVAFTVQQGGGWVRVIDTSQASPQDILSPGAEVALASPVIVGARSVVVAIRKGEAGL